MIIASLESRISADNPIRFINAFVENIDLKVLGFEVQILKTEDRLNFETKIFLKLYLYDYFNGLRSLHSVEKAFFTQISLFQKWQRTPNSGFSPAWCAWLVYWAQLKPKFLRKLILRVR